MSNCRGEGERLNRLDARLDAGENSVYILSPKKDSVATTPHGRIVINLPAEIQTRPGFPNNLPRDAISAFDSRADDGAAGASDAAADDTEDRHVFAASSYKNRITKILCAWRGRDAGGEGFGKRRTGGKGGEGGRIK